MKLHEHIIDFMLKDDDLVDRESLDNLVWLAQSAYLDRSDIDEKIYSFALRCVEAGLALGYSYGRNPDALIMEASE